jgi:multiple sugar transport system substrate-binding protein
VKNLTRRELLKSIGGLALGAAAMSVLSACGGGAAPAATTAPAAKPTEAPKAAAEATKAPEPTKAAEPAKAAAKAYDVQFMYYRGEFSVEEEKFFNDNYAPLKVTQIEFDYQKLDSMLAAKTPPDIWRTYAPAIPGYKARGMLLDLTDRLDQSKFINTKDLWDSNDYYCYAPNGVRPEHGAARYGIVKDFAPDNTIWCWKPAFDEVGVKLWDYNAPPSYLEWLDAAKKVHKQEGDRTIRHGFSPADYWVDRLVLSSVTEIGKSLYSDDFTKCLIGSDKDVTDAIKWWYDAAFSGAQNTALNPIPGGDQAPVYLQGKLGMWQTGYWHTASQQYNHKADQDIDKNSFFVGAPWFFDKTKRVSPTVTACGGVMAKAAKDPDASWTFYEYFFGKEPAETRAKNGWGVPAFKSWFDRLPKNTPFTQRSFTTLQNEMKVMPTLNFNPYIGENTIPSLWAPEIEKALRNKVSADDMLAGIAKEINKLIQEGKDAIGA